MPTRNHWIDQVKGLACLLIVAHHLAFYGPMADQVWPAAPDLMAWLYDHARMAVQVFLVLGGYFCAAALAPQGQMSQDRPLSLLLLKRYLRLSLPFCVAMVLAIFVNELVRTLGFAHDSVSGEATLPQVLAHLLLLHSVGGWESLSAGVWYVAIDFQLYALCAAWFWLAARLPHMQRATAAVTELGVLVLTGVSLLVWNLDSDLDIWAIYFMGAYGLGLMAWWARHAPHARTRRSWALAIAVLTALALWVEWRTRIALAGATALLLATSNDLPWQQRLRDWQIRPLSWLGLRSYSVFLIHFPVCLLVNAFWFWLWPTGVAANALGMLVAIGLSVLAGQLLYQTVESRAVSWHKLLGWQASALGMLGLASWM